MWLLCSGAVEGGRGNGVAEWTGGGVGDEKAEDGCRTHWLWGREDPLAVGEGGKGEGRVALKSGSQCKAGEWRARGPSNTWDTHPKLPAQSSPDDDFHMPLQSLRSGSSSVST